jgi:hypothetical protein
VSDADGSCNPDAVVGATTDPEGNAVILKAETLRGHIASGHKELADRPDLILLAVNKPHDRLPDQVFLDRRLFVRLARIEPIDHLEVLVVPVDYAKKPAEVATAYITRKTNGLRLTREGGQENADGSL